jgi:hypothetical protein
MKNMDSILKNIELLIWLDPIDIHSLQCVSRASKNIISIMYNDQYLWKNKCSNFLNINKDEKLDWRKIYRLVPKYGIISLILNEDPTLVNLGIELEPILDNPILYFSVMFVKGWTDSMDVLLKYNKISLSVINREETFPRASDLNWINTIDNTEYIYGIEWLLLRKEPVLSGLKGWGQNKESLSSVNSLKSMKFILDNMDTYKISQDILYIFMTAASIFEFLDMVTLFCENLDMITLFNEKFAINIYQIMDQNNPNNKDRKKAKKKRRNIPDIDI